MKFLNWMGVTREELMRAPYEMGRDKSGMMIVAGIVFAVLIIRSF